MTINKIKQAAEIAKGRTTDMRWTNAINVAVKGVESGWIVTELAHGIAVTTESGQTYFANGACQCKAFALGQACNHRALARLIEIANETVPVAVSDAEVEAAFAAKFPGYHIADYLLKFYGHNSLRFMNRQLVADIHALILAA